MKNVLLITSSPRGEASFSAKVATALANGISGANVTVRDLVAEPLPHIGADFVHGSYAPEDQRTETQRAALALSEKLVGELMNTDILVIAAGMINFGVPSVLKSWIDNIARAGVTFRYSEAGPEGLVKGKKVVLVLSAGGVYSTGPMSKLDHVEPYLVDTLGFLGMTDIETVIIEGVAYGTEAAEKAVEHATAKAERLAKSYAE